MTFSCGFCFCCFENCFREPSPIFAFLYLWPNMVSLPLSSNFVFQILYSLILLWWCLCSILLRCFLEVYLWILFLIFQSRTSLPLLLVSHLFNYKLNFTCCAKTFEYIYFPVYKFSGCFPNLPFHCPLHLKSSYTHYCWRDSRRDPLMYRSNSSSCNDEYVV